MTKMWATTMIRQQLYEDHEIGLDEWARYLAERRVGELGLTRVDETVTLWHRLGDAGVAVWRQAGWECGPDDYQVIVIVPVAEDLRPAAIA